MTDTQQGGRRKTAGREQIVKATNTAGYSAIPVITCLPQLLNQEINKLQKFVWPPLTNAIQGTLDNVTNREVIPR